MVNCKGKKVEVKGRGVPNVINVRLLPEHWDALALLVAHLTKVTRCIVTRSDVIRLAVEHYRDHLFPEGKWVDLREDGPTPDGTKETGHVGHRLGTKKGGA